jgi:hypothetical protein
MDGEAEADVVAKEGAPADVEASVVMADAGAACDNMPYYDVRDNAHVCARDNDDPADAAVKAGATAEVEAEVSAGQMLQQNKTPNRIKRSVSSDSIQIAAFYSISWTYLCNSYAIAISYFPYNAYLFNCWLTNFVIL